MNGEDKRPIDGDFNGNNQGLNGSFDEKSGRGAEWRGEEENGYFSSRKSAGERWNESSSYGGEDYGSSSENLGGGNGENGGRGYYGGNGENGGDGYFSTPRNGYAPQTEGIYADDSGRRKGLGIAGFILGLISVLCCCLEIIPLVCAILAIIFCVLRIKVKNDGLAIAGLVLGIIGSLFGIFMVILLSSGVMTDLESNYMDIFEEMYGAMVKFVKNFPKKF